MTQCCDLQLVLSQKIRVGDPKYHKQCSSRFSMFIDLHITNIGPCYSVAFLNRTPIFDCCVVTGGLKNNHQKGTCLEEIGLCLHILLTTHLTVNTIGRICAFRSGFQRTWTFDSQSVIKRGSIFNPVCVAASSYICSWQNKCQCVILICRSWRT